MNFTYLDAHVKIKKMRLRMNGDNLAAAAAAAKAAFGCNEEEPVTV